MTNPIESMSEAMSAAVGGAAASVVQVAAGCRRSASGTVWSDTQIVTTHRELPHEDEVHVALADGTTKKAKVLGRDAASDLALLEVDGGLSVPRYADTDAVKVGQLALALGRPGKSIRASLRLIGVVAADVPTEGGGVLRRYVETDRGIPPGFAGGPLLDASGVVLGIQSAGLVRGADLIVPTETIREVAAELAAHGRVRAGFLGVSVQPVRLPKPAQAAVGRGRGALVLGVADGSAAEEAGVHLGDVIVELEGDAIGSGRSLARALRGRFGRELKLKVWRTGSLIELGVTPGERS
ncbi:MAG: S1C family serine protease [Sandaracinaceae bacterium]|nr:S1C family serine protease [Sandaracinaceae bacterium]